MADEDGEEDPRLRRSTDPLIIRIDERTKTIAEEVKLLRASVVSKAEFAPVRLLVFGMVGLVMTAVLTALVAQVIVK